MNQPDQSVCSECHGAREVVVGEVCFEPLKMPCGACGGTGKERETPMNRPGYVAIVHGLVTGAVPAWSGMRVQIATALGRR